MKGDFFYLRTERETAKCAKILFSKKGERKNIELRVNLLSLHSLMISLYPDSEMIDMSGEKMIRNVSGLGTAFGKIKTGDL